VWFADEVDLSQFEDQAGFSINFPTIGSGITNATTNSAPSSRNGKSYNLDETINWVRGKHTLQFGGSYSRVSGWTKAQSLVPTLTLGVDTTNDPANAMFSTVNFPGAAGTDLTNARCGAPDWTHHDDWQQRAAGRATQLCTSASARPANIRTSGDSSSRIRGGPAASDGQCRVALADRHAVPERQRTG
jgi:hypothetical protein